jgi:alpha-glucosidase
VPLPWHTDPAGSFGFSPVWSEAPAWMPQPAGWGRFAADAQAADDASMVSLYRRASGARRASADLHSAAFAVALADDDDLFAFHRGSTLVVINTASSARTLPAELVTGRVVVLSSVVGHDDPTVVPADAAVWLVTS